MTRSEHERPGRGGALAGQTVLVTGGNGGIGLGMARACAEAGAQAVIWGRDAEKNAAAVGEIEELGVTAHAVVCDVSDESAVEEAFASSVDLAGGRIDTVFANAGTTGNGTPFVDVTLEEWRRVLRTNLDGAFLTLRAAARHLITTGGGGCLVAVSSTSAVLGAANNEAYGTSKTALLGLVRALAVGLARHRIRVNALVPGWTVTDLTDPGYASERFRDATIRHTPLRRWADPAEMGPAAVFLADPRNTFHTGDSLVIDGGYTVL